jgi:chemotaxis protein CheD
MGEMSVTAGDGELRTLLGSCIGLALHDRRRKIGGLAHIVLPSARERTDRPGKFADTAIPALIEQMERLAGGELNLIAKMAGGASMFPSTAAGNIGAQNSEACETLLGVLRIPIVSKDCGGTQGRRMAFDTATGRVVIEIVGRAPFEL